MTRTMASPGEILIFNEHKNVIQVLTNDKFALYCKDSRDFFVILRLAQLLFVSHYRAVLSRTIVESN